MASGVLHSNITNSTLDFISTELKSTSTLDSSGFKDVLAWLKMFGIFFGSLAALVVMTLLTCKRPKSTMEVEEPWSR